MAVLNKFVKRGFSVFTKSESELSEVLRLTEKPLIQESKC